MADGSPVITKAPSNRRLPYYGDPLPLTGATTLGRPPVGQQVRLGVPSMGGVPLGREEDRWPQAPTWNYPMEKPESVLQLSGAIVAAGKISTPVLVAGVRPLVGASAVQVMGESAARLLSEAGGFLAGLPSHVHGKVEDSDYISAAESEADLIAYMRERGRTPVADRIEEFLALLAEEPDEAPIAMDSLRSLVSFVLMTPNLRTPIVGADREGLMELEWHLADNGEPDSLWGRGNGVVSLKFLTSGLIQYVALSGPHQKGVERLRKQGESTKEYMLRSLGEFTPRITRA